MTCSYEKFKKEGYDFYVGIPCSKIKDFITDIEKDDANIIIPATREDDALAIAVGAYMAGKKTLVYMQNSGLGHVVNIITSLLKPYGINIHILISLRKHPFEHEYMAKITRNLLKLLDYEDFVTILED